METVWKFTLGRFTVRLDLAPSNEPYDGDDDGETQAGLDSGELVMFDSRVTVTMEGVEIGSDSLCGSVYYAGRESEFWTAHRDPNPLNRNCSIMREAQGQNVSICHYFPDMVRQAVGEARRFRSRLCSLNHAAAGGR